jgi:hypothetical protein
MVFDAIPRVLVPVRPPRVERSVGSSGELPQSAPRLKSIGNNALAVCVYTNMKLENWLAALRNLVDEQRLSSEKDDLFISNPQPHLCYRCYIRCPKDSHGRCTLCGARIQATQATGKSTEPEPNLATGN